MNIEFRFNGKQQIILTPENAKDKMLLQLFSGGHPQLKYAQSPAESPETLIFESFAEDEKKAVIVKGAQNSCSLSPT